MVKLCCACRRCCGGVDGLGHNLGVTTTYSWSNQRDIAMELHLGSYARVYSRTSTDLQAGSNFKRQEIRTDSNLSVFKCL